MICHLNKICSWKELFCILVFTFFVICYRCIYWVSVNVSTIHFHIISWFLWNLLPGSLLLLWYFIVFLFKTILFLLSLKYGCVWNTFMRSYSWCLFYLFHSHSYRSHNKCLLNAYLMLDSVHNFTDRKIEGKDRS